MSKLPLSKSLCLHCGATIFEGREGALLTAEVKCTRCGNVNVYKDSFQPVSISGDTFALIDDVSVNLFALSMKHKLSIKREQGFTGWKDKTKCSQEMLSRLLREHVEKGDPVGVANLAMMLHQRGERII